MVRIFIKFSLTSGISDIKIGLKSGNPKEDVLLYGGSGMRCMGNWSFKIVFFAYDYFYVVFTYELDIIGFSIEVGNGRLISVMNTHNCYSNTDMEAYIRRIVEELELRIPDKYLQTRGWL